MDKEKQTKERSEKYMVQISKEQAEYIREHIPSAHISKTCAKKNRGKKRGKYYVSEISKVVKYLKAFDETIITKKRG